MDVPNVPEPVRKNWPWIVGGGVLLGVVWALRDSFSTSGSTASQASTPDPSYLSAISAGQSAQIEAQARLVESGGHAQAELLNAEANLYSAQMLPILAEYSAGTTIAQTALTQAGQAETSFVQGMAFTTNTLLETINTQAAAAGGTVKSVAAKEQPKFGFTWGDVSASVPLG
jgi:hypothetical protein